MPVKFKQSIKETIKDANGRPTSMWKWKHFYLKEFISASKNVDWTPQVYAGDAIYVKDLTAVLDLNLEQQINHLKCLCSYQCFDRVFLILSKSKYRSEIENSKQV